MLRPTLILLVTLGALTAALLGCKPEATPEAQKAEEWLTAFYKKYTIRGGWAFFGATAKGKNVSIIINIPAQQAKDLAELNQEDAIKIITFAACPPMTEDIWTILQDGDVIIDARSNGHISSTIPCRSTNQGDVQ